MPLKIDVEVTGLKEVRARFGGFPNKVLNALRKALEAALLVIQGSVPSYPVQKPTSYIRTGTLGRSLGSGMRGGTVGQADIYTVKRVGPDMEAHFGSNLSYAPYVVGATRQSSVMKSKGWWTIKTVAERAKDGIGRVFQILHEELVNYLEGK